MSPELLWYLSRINLFADLDAEALAQIDGVGPMTTVPRGTVLVRPAEPAAALYLLKRGRVRLYRLDAQGRPLTMALLGDGNVFGASEHISLGCDDMYAETMEESLLCAMQRPDVERLLREHPEVGMRLITLLSNRVRELEALVASLAHEDVRRRLLRTLVHLADDFGVAGGGMTRISVPLTHEDLASMVASTRETVTATLARLGREGLVRTGRRTLAIDAPGARRALEDGA
jgi:CRP-like cAMP-binding protein